MLKVTPRVENRITAFRQQNFKLFTIGMQVYMPSFTCDLSCKVQLKVQNALL